MIEVKTIIRNDEMLNQVQHDKGGEFSVTLNQVLNLFQDLRFQGLTNTYTSVFDYGLWLRIGLGGLSLGT